MAMAARRRHAGAGAAAAAEWASVSTTGAWRVEPIGKHQLMRRTGLPARDLRALDPALSSYPSSVVGRDRAVVVNLERARAVITASEVLVPGPRDPGVAPLLSELRARLSAPAAASPAPPQAGAGAGAGKDGGVSPPGGGGGGKVLPFEFRALEVCLEYACKSLEHEASMLEKEAYPALDALTSKVSTLNLEHVRQLKSRLVAISGGVHKVRDELEHLLDDDADMAAMHLSEKAAFQAAGGDHSSRFGDVSEEPVRDDEERDGYDDESDEQEDQGSIVFMPKIDELENLLEAYFVQIDGTLNKLSTVHTLTSHMLREYVDDTEDYVNIMLDDKQNQLLQMGVVLSTATLMITGAIVVTAVFGMNIRFALYYTTDTNIFWEANGGMVGGATALFIVTMLYLWKKGILR